MIMNNQIAGCSGISQAISHGTTQAMHAAFVKGFLDAFAQKAASYGQACEQYQRGEITIADITRHLSQATADAEFHFSEHSHSLGLEQLQRYGMIQKQIDKQTVQVFETEIASNRKTILDAIENGDYFIVNLTYNAIKSSIYMICATQKIKTRQEQLLAEAQQELEIAQTFIKVLKALESVIRVEGPDQLEWSRIQKTLAIYRDYFSASELIPLKLASDQRVFGLFTEHVQLLEKHQPAGWLCHLAFCRNLLAKLAHSPDQHARLASWQALQASPQPESCLPAGPQLKPAAQFSERLGQAKPPVGELSRRLDKLNSLLNGRELGPDCFAPVESSLLGLVECLQASGGLELQSAPAHRVFSLFEAYVDFLCNLDFAGEPLLAAEHISRCCQLIEPLAQSTYERQMLEAWRSIRTSPGVICATPRASAGHQESAGSPAQAMLTLFQTLEDLFCGKLQLDYALIELAIAAYCRTYAQTTALPIRFSLDERIFGLYEKHVDRLLNSHFAVTDPAAAGQHIAACCKHLEPLAQDILRQELIRAWRILSEAA